MKIIDRKLLDDLSAAAKDNPRLRKNWNIHPNDEFPAHRLLNAMEPSSYIRPHRHLDPLKDETFMVVRGRLGVIMFDDEGALLEKVLLESGGDRIGVDLPSGVFHTAISLEEGTIFFEAKAGPYLPFTEAERPSWAPEDGTPEALAYLESLRKIFL